MALDEDAALLPRLRAGEEAAFRELVRRHHTRLVRLAAGPLVQRRPPAREGGQEVVKLDDFIARLRSEALAPDLARAG